MLEENFNLISQASHYLDNVNYFYGGFIEILCEFCL